DHRLARDSRGARGRRRTRRRGRPFPAASRAGARRCGPRARGRSVFGRGRGATRELRGNPELAERERVVGVEGVARPGRHPEIFLTRVLEQVRAQLAYDLVLDPRIALAIMWR